MSDMNCGTYAGMLAELLEGRLSSADRLRAEEHCRKCADCRDLKRSVADDLGDIGIEAPGDLLPAVLARTSGSACGSARGRLCDHVDRALGAIDDELIRQHLEGCGECAGMSRALVRISQELPRFAEMQPDERFLPEVIARTVPRRRRVGRWVTRFSETWWRLARRPRFAWEGAYIGMIGLALAFGAPNSPLADVPRQALNLVRINPIAGLSEPIEVYGPRVRSAWQAKSAQVSGAAREIGDDLSRRSSGALAEIRTELGTLWQRITSEKTTNDNQRPAENAGRSEGE